MDTIYTPCRVTTRLIANRIILPLAPFLSLSLVASSSPSVSVVASFSHPLRVPLFTFVRPFSERPQAKQTYGVLTLNKLSDFVIGLP